ncbi:hypothetical protein ACH4S8_32145 [Streptomyces sp. NPDC021080]|uniref:hypothetical protein n=1 Tax=Streptomyces sp. NPDC021080 TaxID=3365110 RepID=UPI0037B7D9D3
MEHEVFVPFPAGRLREALADPVRVARAIPGLQQDASAVAGGAAETAGGSPPVSGTGRDTVGGSSGAGLGPGAGAARVAGRLKVRVAGHTITYRGAFRVTAQGDGSYAVEGDATEVRGGGAVKLALTLRLLPADGGTTLSFGGTASGDGRVAELPHDAVSSAGQRLLTRFGETLTTDLASRAGSGSATGPTAAPSNGTGSAVASPGGSGSAPGPVTEPEAGFGPGAAPTTPEPESGGEPGSASHADAGPETETEAEAEADPQARDQAVPGREPAAGLEPEPDSEPDLAPEADADAEAGVEADADADAGVEADVEPAADAEPAPDPDAPPGFESDVVPPSPDPLGGDDEFDGEDFVARAAEPGRADAMAEAAHARRTMIGRSAEEVDHAPPRGRYAPVPPPEATAARATLRWAAPAAALALASAIALTRALRKRR